MKLTTRLDDIAENCSNCCNQLEKKSSPWTELDGKSPSNLKCTPRTCGWSSGGLNNIKGLPTITVEWGRCPSCRRIFKRKSETVSPIEEE